MSAAVMDESLVAPPVDLELSRKFSRLLGAQPQQCFHNAASLACVMPELEAVYVEGYVIREGLPLVFDHGWVELVREDGVRVTVDTTPAFCGLHEDEDDELGTLLQRPATYFPARRYTPEALIGRMGEAEDGGIMLPLFDHVLPNRDPAMMRAFVAAHRAMLPPAAFNFMAEHLGWEKVPETDVDDSPITHGDD